MNYKTNWTQSYITWVSYADRMTELQIELSEYKEANAVIDFIKSL